MKKMLLLHPIILKYRNTEMFEESTGYELSGRKQLNSGRAVEG